MRRPTVGLMGIAALLGSLFFAPAFGAPTSQSLGLRAAEDAQVRFKTCSSFGTDFNIAGSILVGVAPTGMLAIMVPGSAAVGGAARVAFAAGA